MDSLFGIIYFIFFSIHFVLAFFGAWVLLKFIESIIEQGLNQAITTALSRYGLNDKHYFVLLIFNYTFFTCFMILGCMAFLGTREFNLDNYNNFIEIFVNISFGFILIIGSLFVYWYTKYHDDTNEFFEGNAHKFNSMYDLYHVTFLKRILGKRKKEFDCIYCGAKLEVVGKFRCRAGHIPQTNRHIFDNCHMCDDIFEYIQCSSCNKDISLFDENYNQEDINNRGKDYISRATPYKKLPIRYSIWLIFYFICASVDLVFLLFLSNPKLNILTTWSFIGGYTIAGFILCLLHYVFFVSQKDIVMENPYLKRD